MVLTEFAEVQAVFEAEQAARGDNWGRLLRSKANRKRLCLAALATFMPQLNGQAIISYYCMSDPYLFGQWNTSRADLCPDPIVFGLVGITSPSVQTGIGAGLNMYVPQVSPFIAVL